MKVEDVCTRVVTSCTGATPLSDASTLMSDGECAVLPVLDDAGKVLGVITDRDICTALALTGPSAPDLPVRTLLRPTLHACRSSDSLREALGTMRTWKVHALPVVDGAGLLQGMLSLDDIALASKPDRTALPSDVTYEDLALALKAMSRRRRPLKIPDPDPHAKALV